MKNSSSGQTDDRTMKANTEQKDDAMSQKLLWLKAFGNIDERFVDEAAAQMSSSQNRKRKDVRKISSARYTTILATAAAAFVLLFIARQVTHFVPVTGEDKNESVSQEYATAEYAAEESEEEVPDTEESVEEYAAAGSAAANTSGAEEFVSEETAEGTAPMMEAAPAEAAAEDASSHSVSEEHHGVSLAQAAAAAQEGETMRAESALEFDAIESDAAEEAKASGASADEDTGAVFEHENAAEVSEYEEAAVTQAQAMKEGSEALVQGNETVQDDASLVNAPSASVMEMILSADGLKTGTLTAQRSDHEDGSVQIHYVDQQGNTIVKLTRAPVSSWAASVTPAGSSATAAADSHAAGKNGINAAAEDSSINNMAHDDSMKDMADNNAESIVRWEYDGFHYTADFGSLTVSGQVRDELYELFR